MNLIQVGLSERDEDDQKVRIEQFDSNQPQEAEIKSLWEHVFFLKLNPDF